jgi:O-antigen ligase
MSRRDSLLLVGWVILVNAAACLLFSGAGPMDRSAPALQAEWHPLLRLLAALLTFPLPTPEIADIRDLLLSAGLGGAALLLAVDARRPLAASAGPARAGPVETWLPAAAGGVAALALLSTAVNHSFSLSAGWIARFLCGSLWALLIARRFSARMARLAFQGLMAAAAATLLLAISHRASRGLAHFTWPIGPITPTAALAAGWAAASAAAGAALLRSRRPAACLLLGNALLCLYVLLQTHRRGPLLALAAALLLCAGLAAWRRLPSRIARAGLIAAGLVAAGAAGAYVYSRYTSQTREAAWSVAVRLGYWKLCGGLVSERPLLGAGPDTFVVHMTNAVAPLRAASPWLYEGNIDPSAHNEWLQAAVELGLPAGVLYLLLPLVPMCAAARRLARAGPTGLDPAALPIVAGCLAGLVAILVLESASVTLRGPIMPAWYWTLLGLLVAALRTPAVRPGWRLRLLARPPGLREGLLAACCAAVCIHEAVAAVAESRGQPDASGRFPPRLFAEKTVYGRYRAASLALRRAAGDRTRVEHAVSLWQELDDLIPGFAGVHEGHARALLLAGREDSARSVLACAVGHRFDPYGAGVNTLYASLQRDDAAARLACVQRALRTSALDGDLEPILVECMTAPPAQAALLADCRRAAEFAAAPLDDRFDSTAPESLRIRAFLRLRERDFPSAIADQRLAAELYRRMETGLSRYRRAGDAEWDTFYRLARMLYDADPAHYRQACDAIIDAERYAVLSIRHERVARPEAGLGFVIGEVMPTEFPERLRPLWRLSALLHLMAGDFAWPHFRVGFSLPPDQWSIDAMNRQTALAARQAYQQLARLPAERRPPYLGGLLALAQSCDRAATQPEAFP